jgi:predicted ABC-type ATPase
MSRKPELIVIAGPNGSGKTSITRKLIEANWSPGVYINPDEIAQKDFGGWNDLASVQKAALKAEQMRNELLAQRKSMTFETVMSTRSKVDFIQQARDADYFIRVFYVCTENPTINAMRVAQRVMEGGHTVPIEKIISRYERSIALAAPALAIADRGYLYDNSGHEAHRWLRTVEGKPVERYAKKMEEEDAPLWIKKIMIDLSQAPSLAQIEQPDDLPGASR